PAPAGSSALIPPRIRVIVARDGAEHAARLLFANPFQEWPKLGRGTQRGEAREGARQVGVPKSCMDLLVTMPANRRAMLGLAALLARGEVMQRDQIRRNESAAEIAALRVAFVRH